MRTFLIRRLLSFIPTMLLFYTLVFALIKLTPGNPWDTAEKPFRPEVLAKLEEKYHYNDPVWKQYLDYLRRIFFHFDFGPSYKRNVDANEIVSRYFPVSLQLGAVAFVIAIVFGISLGVISAIKQNTFTDHLAMLFSVIGVATPSFVVITLMIIVLAVNLGFLPAYGWDGIFSKEIIIPAIALSLGPMAVIARSHARLDARDDSDGLRADRPREGARRATDDAAPRAPERLDSSRHHVRVGPGRSHHRVVFRRGDLRRTWDRSVLRQHGRPTKTIPVLMAVTLLFAALIWLMNFLADVAYAVIDPRVKVS